MLLYSPKIWIASSLVPQSLQRNNVRRTRKQLADFVQLEQYTHVFAVLTAYKIRTLYIKIKLAYILYFIKSMLFTYKVRAL
jgi:hypothetical protein